MPPQQQMFDVEAIKEMLKGRIREGETVNEETINNFVNNNLI